MVGCRNEGGIQADTNVGGIAGAVSPELSLDPEENLELDSENLLVDTTALLKAILYQCDNRGPVTAKNECAGGVLGRGEVGAALSCTSMGPVGPTTAPLRAVSRALRGVLRSCAAQADVTGDSSLGGIAGEGRDIADCIAMTRIDGSGERLGAVAGWADGTVSGNYYLQEKAVGIDGIDYAGQTAPPGPSPPWRAFRRTFSPSASPSRPGSRWWTQWRCPTAAAWTPPPSRKYPATAGAMAGLTTTTDGALRRRTPPASRRGSILSRRTAGAGTAAGAGRRRCRL